MVEGEDGNPGALVPQLQTLLKLWRRRYGARPLPCRSRLDMPSLKPWLFHRALIDTGLEGEFHIRAFGPGLIRRFGREATDTRIGELAGDVAAGLRETLWRTMAEREPVAAWPSVYLGKRIAPARFCELSLPLACEDGRVVALLLASYEVEEK